MYLADIWPSSEEITAVIRDCVRTELLRADYADIFAGEADYYRHGGILTYVLRSLVNQTPSGPGERR